jgi:hypothetical protein
MAAIVSCAMAMRIGQSKPGWSPLHLVDPAEVARPTKSLDALLPVLYLRGVSTSDFQEALAALLGKDAPNMSSAVVSRLTAEWQADYDVAEARPLGEAIRVRVGGRDLSAGPNGRSRACWC